MTKRFTIDEFHARFPNEDSCLQRLFDIRYSNLVCKCGNEHAVKPFTKVKNRKSYQCGNCGYQISPMANTIFEKTTLPLSYWFYVVFCHSVSKNGVSALEISRTLNICYKTSLRMSHKVQLLMANNKTIDKLIGEIQIDESWFGQKAKNMHKKKRAELHASNADHNINKTGVMGFVSNKNDVRFEVMTDFKTFKQRVRKNVDFKSVVVTDSHSSYKGLDIEYLKHEVVNHIADQYMNEQGYHTNKVENAWSQLKRVIKGCHIHVSVKHLQKYADSVAFKMMHKDKQDQIFDIILSHVA